VYRGEEGAADQLGVVARLRRAARFASAGREPRRLLPARPQRAGEYPFLPIPILFLCSGAFSPFDDPLL
jgi:hypothetical protein